MNRIEYWIVSLLGIVSIVLISWFLISDSSPFSQQPVESESVVVRATNTPAEVLRSGQNYWSPLVPGDSLKAGDSVRSFTSGTIELLIGSDGYMRVSAPFEIGLEQPNIRVPARLQLRNGSIHYRFTGLSAGLPTEIATPEGSFLFDRSSARASTPKEAFISNRLGDIRVAVLSGGGQWQYSNNVVPMEVGEKLTKMRNSGSLSKTLLSSALEITNPEENEVFFPGYMLRGFNLVWRPVTDASGYLIRIYSESNGSQSLLQFTESETNALRIQNLSPGRYMAQSAALSANGTPGLWSDLIPFTISGRAFGSLNCREQTATGISANIRAYRDHYMIGGCVSGIEPDLHHLLIYAQTDVWWIQPLADNFIVTIDSDGYFESFLNQASEVYIMAVSRNKTRTPETYQARTSLPRVGQESVVLSHFIRVP